MTNRKFYFFILLLFTILIEAKSQNTLDPNIVKILQRKLDSCVTQFKVPGISASLILPGGRFWNGASGLSDIETKEALDTSMLFQQASVCKMFAATLLFQMIEENKLSLDDTIGRFLPPLKNVPANTKIRYLLNMRSGIADILANQNASSTWISSPDSIWKPENVINTYCGALKFKQNGNFDYSNTNYILLGMVIEKIAQKPVNQVLKERILQPYGLKNIFLDPFDPIVGTQAQGWTSFSQPNVYDTNASLILNACSSSMFFMAGGIIAQPSEVAKFTRLLWSGKILSASSLTTMKTCTNVPGIGGGDGYGYGTIRYKMGGKVYYGHGGDVNGFTLMSVHQETDNVTITIGINRNGASRVSIANILLNVIKPVITDTKTPHQDLPFQVFPNPTDSELYIKAASSNDRNDLKIKLLDNMGRVVDQREVNGTELQSLSTSHLPNGLYLLEVSQGQYKGQQKIMIMH